MVFLTFSEIKFGLVIPKKLTTALKKFDKRVIKCKKRVPINRSKTTSLSPNLGAAASLKSKA